MEIEIKYEITYHEDLSKIEKICDSLEELNKEIKSLKEKASDILYITSYVVVDDNYTEIECYFISED